MLKIIEGALANVPPQGGRKHPHQEFLQIDTRNILFIVGGTFSGLDEVIRRRIGANSSIGFGSRQEAAPAADNDLLSLASPEDLVQHGMIPEMVGRLPVQVALKPLDLDELVRIMIEPKNALIRQYQHLLSLDKVELVFEDAAMRAAAELALERDTGARGLRSIIEACLLNVMFEAPSHDEINKVVISASVIRGEESPQVYSRDGGVLDLTGKIDTAA